MLRDQTLTRPLRIATISLIVVASVQTWAEPISMPGGAKLEQVDFERHIMGVIGLMGCNSGACHGSFQGRGGFRLSLFGYDFEMDHQAISEYIDTEDPEASYLLEKATLATDHGGGKRFDEASWQYQVIRRWVADGGLHLSDTGKVQSLVASPSQMYFERVDELSQLKVIATYSDGLSENVTSFCDFRMIDDYVANVTSSGMVQSLRPGDTAIVAQYRGQIVSAQVLVSAPLDKDFIYPKIESTNRIDQLVQGKLRLLNVVPSRRADDFEFIRRVFIDTIGRLPNLDEIRVFRDDSNPLKRAKLIDRLLGDPLHASLWATKFNDMTGNRTESLPQPRVKRSTMWHEWFERRLKQNVSYKELARGVLTATSRDGRPPEQWTRETRSIDEAALVGFDTNYAERDSLDLFWMRRNMNLETLSEQIAAAFLGIRMGCAKCHKHPYDRWTQVDYRAFAGVFGQVKLGVSSESRSAIEAENQRRKAIVENDLKLPELQEVFVNIDRPRRFGHPKTNRALMPKAPGGPEFLPNTDTRKAFFDWLSDDDNPYFAASFVNRIWEHYFGKGIVDPVDDFSIGNPPSNRPLLEELSERFIRSGYDIRQIECDILNSRTYQTSSMPNEFNRHDRHNFARAYPRRMMAEVTVDVLDSALDVVDRFPQDAPDGSRAIQVANTDVRDRDLRFAFQVFGRPKRESVCDCERSSDPALAQTLFYMADEETMAKIRRGRLRNILVKENRISRLQNDQMTQAELTKILDEIWLSTLTRPPTTAELRRSTETLRRSEDPVETMVDLFWAVINTREFILNH